MIEAIIHYQDSTLIMDLPRNIYDIHEKLMSIGCPTAPGRIPLTDNEDDALRVKLYGRIEMGNHLIRILSEQNTLADANTLAFAVLNASDDIKLKLGEKIVKDQYGSIPEIVADIRQMTYEAGPIKRTFYCPLVGNIEDGYHEYDQFLIGITKLENPTEKDLINLTFNLDHFTLCKDVSSYGKIGREYVMNTEGAVPAHDEDDPKYAAIGKDLIDRGLAQITAKGLLIYNPFDELTEVYDGQTFPEYYYENSLASAEVSYNGRTELLLLPGEEIAIKKALARLGAPSDSDCEIKFCLSQGEDDAWEERIEGIIRSEGLYEANKMLRSLDTGDMDWGKLTAAVELANVKSAANIAAVAEHLGEFAFIPDAKSESDVGHFLVDNVDEYAMNIEMEEYFDFSGFGEYFAEEHDGQFVNGGFAYFDSDRSLDEYLEELESEDEGMDMGGM